MTTITLFLTCLLLAAPGRSRLSPEASLTEADGLAAHARAQEPGPSRDQAVARALSAYDAVIAARPKDRRLVPRVRRRKATLLKAAGRPRDALAEYDAIAGGRARRKERARALYEGALLLERGGDFHAAERRLSATLEEYGDVTSVRAKANLARGRVFEAMGRPRQAERCYREIVERCREDAKIVIAAHDALALLELAAGRPGHARRWLRACTRLYEKRAARDDRFGAFVARQLGAMEAPRRLAEYEAARRPRPDPP